MIFFFKYYLENHYKHLNSGSFMDLFTNYKYYYKHPTITNANLLFQSIINYDFEDSFNFQKSIINESKSIVGDNNAVLHTSGSKWKSPQKYIMGPYANFWISKIENHLRCLKNPSSMVFLNTTIQNFTHYSNQDHNYKFDYRIRCRYDIDFLISKLIELDIKSIFGYPNAFLFLLGNKKFSEALEERKWDIISTDFEPFFPKKQKDIYFNDQMIDWRSGLNFYTCRYGNKHCLPIFADGINLINLCYHLPQQDDYFKIKRFYKCDCGKTAIDFDFIPHVKHAIIKKDGTYFFDCSIANNLVGNYISLQFIQVHDIINVVYVCHDYKSMPEEDIVFLENVLKKYEFDYIFLKNRYCITGGAHKRSSFYRDGDIKRIDIKQKLI